MLAHGALSNHTSNLTSSQSLGVFLQESSSRMERNEGMKAREAWLVREREVNEGGVKGYIYSHHRK